MNKTVHAGARSGAVTIPASKSAAHRQLICAALSEGESRILCDGISKDIQATMDCLAALGAQFTVTDDGIRVVPCDLTRFRSASGETVDRCDEIPAGACRYEGTAGERILPCGESGSTLRFLMPIAAALGVSAVFHMEGKLPERPHKELIEELTKHGAMIRQDGAKLYCSGTLKGGLYELPGNVSSQFISGLLFALPLLKEDSTLRIAGKIESAAYIAMTEQAISEAGIRFTKSEQAISEADSRITKTWQEYRILGGQTYRAKAHIEVERDWSNAAFFLCAGAFSKKGVTVKGLRADSVQGDKAILKLLRDFGADIVALDDGIHIKHAPMKGQVIDASEIPDLVPVLSVLAAGAEGETRIIHAERLRFKESDRLKTTAAMLTALGGTVAETEDGLMIRGTGRLTGGTVCSANDHRIAMAAAIAAGICREDVIIQDAGCIAKSYPAFYSDLEELEVLS